ncbi:competence type IV pilus major pilin ComGC [Oceanobacillus halotolerans]|uniref:competence type IV pilus major pilin ComGC n=1 Tax=Oceanobacillus halotolerans TaxID=2663380 RepID=UPI0013DAB145|nr:type II secretion system protein [Oceanobacillus halotolerans]
MLQQIQKLMKKQKGFTLVELLAVIAILGIIVAIAVPTIGNVIGESEDDAKIANVELILNAARLADASGEDVDGWSVEDLRNNGYLEEIPTIPGSDEGIYGGNISKDTDADGNGSITYTVGNSEEVPASYISETESVNSTE